MGKNKFSYVWAGLIGGVAVGATIIVFFSLSRVFDYKMVYFVNPEKIQVDSLDTARISVPEYQLLESMRDKELLLTPAEYTNNLVGYYNALIAFLAIFFVIFTFVSYFYIRNQSKAEIRDEARDLLKDSMEFRQELVKDFQGIFDPLYVTSDDFEKYEDVIKNIQKDILELQNSGGKSKVKKIVKKQ
jgi:hypothetical protein